VISRMTRRRVISRIMTGATVLAALLALLPLFAIFGDLVAKGASSINLEFFIENPAPAGSSGGGVANAIVGTLIIVALGGAIGLPVGIGAGVYLAEYGSGKMGWVVRFLADVLNGTPSVIVGIFVWTWIVRPMGHFSALSGSIALAVLMLPMVTRTTEEMVRLVPNSLREAALALGYPRWRTSLAVMVRSAWPGIMTGGLVAIARIAGETAPLLFTALGNLNFKTNVMQPMQTLSLQIYVFATGPFEEWHRLAWGSALVLMAIVLIVGLGARYFTRTRFQHD
jgi:phosphate transport system permease protein